LLLAISCTSLLSAQSDFSIRVRSGDVPLAGATIQWKEAAQQLATDSAGKAVFQNIKPGRQTFIISHIGFGEERLVLSFPIPADSLVDVALQPADEEEEEEIVINITRTSRTITNTPTRVEVISGEELEEKGNMKPGDIRMLLNESTGIQTQQTSATSYNAAIRIQGLDGRYTQILRDGFPLYAGFAGGLSILQIAPLDLKQVEVVKGSASTLYGGGAIAGLVNLVSKVPTDRREISFMTNVSSAGALDLSGFYSQRFGKAGVTVFGSRNSHAPFDPAGIGLTAIPKFERYTINPRLFFYGSKTTGQVAANYTTEDRTGGSISYIKDKTPGFFELNNTARLTTQLALSHSFGEGADLNFKNSYTHFKRNILLPAYFFGGVQKASYSELNLNLRQEKLQWITGLNVLTDLFAENGFAGIRDRSYDYTTYGAFVQNTWGVTDLFTVESGLRADYTKPFGFVLLPRLSLLFRPSQSWTLRIGGGAGYKNPSVFNEEAERIQFRNIMPVDETSAVYERSGGGNFDVNYKTTIGELGVSINQLFFYTRLNRPFVLDQSPGVTAFSNADGFIDTKGGETNLKLTWSDFKLFTGYTFTDAKTNYSGAREWLPLTARHRLNNVLVYEREGSLKIGLEAYYFSPQRLSDNTVGRSYWIAGLMGEKLFQKFSLFINFENFTDTRQSRFGPIYSGSISNPQFRDIYAPVEGFVVNGGFKIKL
ncbi:MAG TPA: TonB-dependent receptor, partial [Flavisolibacter sp.]|nr:TonB-dependent receptor [Flavisolibacter sp.]